MLRRLYPIALRGSKRMIDQLIGESLYDFIRDSVTHSHDAKDANDRFFFCVRGFDSGVYQTLIKQIELDELHIDERPICLKTVVSVDGRVDLALERDKSQTWYRNHLPSGHVLVLVQNAQTTDAQSLKSLFRIDESKLVDDGLNLLIDRAFKKGYTLAPREVEILSHFLNSYRSSVHEPQLRSLVAFLASVHREIENNGLRIEDAISECLPHLGLFKYRVLSKSLRTSSLSRLLSEIYRNARMGSELLDERELEQLLEKVQEHELEDDSDFGGMSPADKRDALVDFLKEVGNEEKALRIDWSEVKPILYKKKASSKSDRLMNLAEQIENSVSDSDISDSPQVEDVLEELRTGQLPSDDNLEQVISEFEDSFGKKLTNSLRKLIQTTKHQNPDFLVGLLCVASDISLPHQDDLTDAWKLEVSFKAEDQSDSSFSDNELFLAFRHLYGSIESIFPSLSWSLDRLWSRCDEVQLDEFVVSTDEDTNVPDSPQHTHQITFGVSLHDANGDIVGRGELIWLYPSDSPAAMTFAEHSALNSIFEVDGPFIPIYEIHNLQTDLSKLDLYRPMSSIGRWFSAPTKMNEVILNKLQNRTGVSNEATNSVLDSLKQLSKDYQNFLSTSLKQGIFGADVEGLLDSYGTFLKTAMNCFDSEQAARGFEAISPGWIVRLEGNSPWAVVPFSHPLKLLWWQNRALEFQRMLKKLLDPSTRATPVNQSRFKKSLSQTYGSSSFPSLLTLPGKHNCLYYMPQDEVEGYELYHPISESSIVTTMDSQVDPSEEVDSSPDIAAQSIAAVIQNYIQTFPFVKDGVEITLVNCRNGALPGLLVKSAKKVLGRNYPDAQLYLAVHTNNQSAPIFGQITDWQNNNEEFVERSPQAYFPHIQVQVLECEFDELVSSIQDKDLVVLVDVLGNERQEVDFRSDTTESADIPLSEFLPISRGQLEPFERGQLRRDILLNGEPQPFTVRMFFNLLAATFKRKPISTKESIRFVQSITLSHVEHQLETLHKLFNWVICYDTNADRYLLEDTVPGINVIRYSMGLGPKQKHSLTVSSAEATRRVVEKKLAAQLSDLFPRTPDEFRARVAEQLVAHVKDISGDIVLRAAGPGTFLNELIGIVSAKTATERMFESSDEGEFTTWIYLDDVRHWFDGKYPDLLLVNAKIGDTGKLKLHICVLETKCLSDSNLLSESRDAEVQVLRGLNRLGPALRPGGNHLDSRYWYAQLYKAVAGNLILKRGQEEIWSVFREGMTTGDFEIDFDGHSWIFCHDKQGVVPDGKYSIDEDFSKRPDDLPEADTKTHFFSRAGLRNLLLSLVESLKEQGVIACDIPESASDARYDLVSEETGEAIEAAEVEEVEKVETETVADYAEHEKSADTSEKAEPNQISIPLELELPSEETQESANSPDDSTSLVSDSAITSAKPDEHDWLEEKSHKIDRILRQYSIEAFPVDFNLADVGPSVVRFKLRLRPGEHIAKLKKIAEELERELALKSPPLIDNVLGSHYVGIDLPRKNQETVPLTELFGKLHSSILGELPVVLGLTPSGETVIEDLSEFPHLLVAGATGSGKSVFLRSVLLGLLDRFSPKELRLLIVDPKRTDFSFFNDVPHLYSNKVITNQEEARDKLLELVRDEMPRRQSIMEGRSFKIKEFNQRYPEEALPPILAIIDEYAQLISIMGKKERDSFERDLMSLAAVARATGIHLILATQRPSHDVVTGTLKANLPAAIAFKVASSVNSRIVIDATGAENLFGKGDMLFKKPSGELVRIQSPYIDEVELVQVLDRIKAKYTSSAPL